MNFNKRTISKNFSKASENYNKSALVQKIAAKKLCEIVEPLIKDESKIIDLGSGTSAIYRNLTSSTNFSKKHCELFEADLSLKMLKSWPEKLSKNINSIIGDGENLPLKSESFDVIISSFSLQWLQDFEKVFVDFYRILRKGGILAFCIPNSSSLEETKIASVESGCNFHFSELPKVEDLQSKLQTSGFKSQFSESEKIEFQFEDALLALKSLKEIGANYSDKKRFISTKQLSDFKNFGLESSTEDQKFSVSWGVSYFIFYK